MMTMIEAPKRVGSREQAQEMADGHLVDDLTGSHIVVDFVGTVALRPSFFDELVKAVLVERRAAGLQLVRVPELGRDAASRSARSRGVLDRLSFG